MQPEQSFYHCRRVICTGDEFFPDRNGVLTRKMRSQRSARPLGTVRGLSTNRKRDGATLPPARIISARGGFSRALGDSSARGGIQRAWAGMSGGGAASGVGAQVMAMGASRHAWRPQERGGHRDGCAPKSWTSESSPVQSYDRLSDFQRIPPRLCTVDGTFLWAEIEFWCQK